MAPDAGSGLKPEVQAAAVVTAIRFLFNHNLGPTVTEKAVVARYIDKADDGQAFKYWVGQMVAELNVAGEEEE